MGRLGGSWAPWLRKRSDAGKALLVWSGQGLRSAPVLLQSWCLQSSSQEAYNQIYISDTFVDVLYLFVFVAKCQDRLNPNTSSTCCSEKHQEPPGDRHPRTVCPPSGELELVVLKSCDMIGMFVDLYRQCHSRFQDPEIAGKHHLAVRSVTLTAASSSPLPCLHPRAEFS